MELMVLPFSRYFTGAFISPQMKALCLDNENLHSFENESLREKEIYLLKDVPLGGENAYAEWNKVQSYMPKYFKSMPHQIGHLNFNEKSQALHFFQIEKLGQTEIEKVAIGEFQTLWKQILNFHHKKATVSHILEAKTYLDAPFEKVFSKGRETFGSIPSLKQEIEILKEKENNEVLDVALQQWLEAIKVAQSVQLPLIKNLLS